MNDLSDPASPEISVVVPHYSDLSNLDRCLAALEQQDYPRERFEIVVADNGSPEGESAVGEVIRGRARLTVVSEKGAGPARNGGVAAARGRILAFTDSDCRPQPGWLAAGAAALSDWDFVGGRMTVLVNDARHMTGAEAFETVFAFDNETYVRTKSFTVTANLFCPRAVFDAVGGFRTGVSEDLEWSHRAGGAGYRIGYAPGAVVGHPARRSWCELRRKWQRLNAETYGLYAGRPLGKFRWVMRSWLLPISAVAHAPRVLASPRLPTLGQRGMAVALLFRLRLWRFVDAHRLLFSAEKR